jgi:serine/threonine protein phosphatase PrpC
VKDNYDTSPELMAEKLIVKAYNADPHDNITAIIVKVS